MLQVYVYAMYMSDICCCLILILTWLWLSQGHVVLMRDHEIEVPEIAPLNSSSDISLAPQMDLTQIQNFCDLNSDSVWYFRLIQMVVSPCEYVMMNQSNVMSGAITHSHWALTFQIFPLLWELFSKDIDRISIQFFIPHYIVILPLEGTISIFHLRHGLSHCPHNINF